MTVSEPLPATLEPSTHEKRQACMDKLANLDSAINAWESYLAKPEPDDAIMCMKHQKIRAGLWFCRQERQWIERLLKDL